MIRARQIYFETFFLFLLLFAAHRIVTFSDLRPDDFQEGYRQIQAFFVGFLSDLWVAQLLGILFALLSFLLALLQKSTWIRPVQGSLMVASTFGLAAHQAYVQFFKFTLIPFHALYLGDGSFLVSNIRSILGGPLILHGFALSLGYFLLRWVVRPGLWSSKILNGIMAFVFLATLLAHNRNIHWRVQWFIPENLQMHFLERGIKLYLESRPVDPLSGEELTHLENIRQPRSSALHPLAEALQKNWRSAVRAGEKPIFLIVLMESMRPAESGYFAEHFGIKDAKPSLTPELDALAKKSLVFYQAFSSGSVTRGGQEASFCGQLSSRDTSMMRGGSVHPFPCLPDIIARKNQIGEAQGFSFWYHGGHPEFDNQKSFWKARGTHELMTQEDFGPEVAKTDWGVGDASFLTQVGERLSAAQKGDSHHYAVGMALTVSHHIPWGIPADAMRLNLEDVSVNAHPSYRTAAYADHALGDFVRSLEARDIWQNMIVVFVSDHGNTLPPYHQLYGVADTYADLKLESHIQMMVSGGILERSLGDLGLAHLAWDIPVSQVDVPSLFASLQAWSDFGGMGEHPLVLQRRKPILSQLESALFAPILPARFIPADYQQARSGKIDGKHDQTLVFYRSYLNQSYQAGSSKSSAP